LEQEAVGKEPDSRFTKIIVTVGEYHDPDEDDPPLPLLPRKVS